MKINHKQRKNNEGYRKKGTKNKLIILKINGYRLLCQH